MDDLDVEEVGIDDVAIYTEQVFKMYKGPTTDITIEFDDKLIRVIQDKFGEDTKIVRTSKKDVLHP